MLWILVVILLAMVLLCLLRVHITAEFKPTVLLTLCVGPVNKQIYPVSKIEEQSVAKKSTEKTAKRNGNKIPKPGFSDICNAYETLKPALLKALRRTRRGICIDPLALTVVLGGREDPAAAAEHFGYANAVVWSLMPVLERLVKIPNPSIHLDVDFEAERLCVTGSVGVNIRVGTILLVAFGLAIPALRWLLKYSKVSNTEKRKPIQASSV